MTAYNFSQLDIPGANYYNFAESDDEMSENDSEKNKMECDETDSASECDEAKSVAPSTSASVATKRIPKPNKNKIDGNDFVELEFEFLVGDKSNSQLLSTKCDHYVYRKHSKGPLGIRYSCHDDKCPASVTLCPNTNICKRFGYTPVHKHKKNEEDYRTHYWNLVAKTEMRRQCSNLATLAGGKRLASVRSIFSNVMQQ